MLLGCRSQGINPLGPAQICCHHFSTSSTLFFAACSSLYTNPRRIQMPALCYWHLPALQWSLSLCTRSQSTNFLRPAQVCCHYFSTSSTPFSAACSSLYLTAKQAFGCLAVLLVSADMSVVTHSIVISKAGFCCWYFADGICIKSHNFYADTIPLNPLTKAWYTKNRLGYCLHSVSTVAHATCVPCF